MNIYYQIVRQRDPFSEDHINGLTIEELDIKPPDNGDYEHYYDEGEIEIDLIDGVLHEDDIVIID